MEVINSISHDNDYSHNDGGANKLPATNMNENVITKGHPSYCPPYDTAEGSSPSYTKKPKSSLNKIKCAFDVNEMIEDAVVTFMKQIKEEDDEGTNASSPAREKASSLCVDIHDPGLLQGIKHTFPFKLHDMLSDEKNSDCITWSEDGKAWKVIDERLLEKVLPNYYGHANFRSFVRQAYLWKFRRLPNGNNAGYFYHELFTKEEPSRCKYMERNKKKPKKQHKTAVAAAVEHQGLPNVAPSLMVEHHDPIKQLGLQYGANELNLMKLRLQYTQALAGLGQDVHNHQMLLNKGHSGGYNIHETAGFSNSTNPYFSNATL